MLKGYRSAKSLDKSSYPPTCTKLSARKTKLNNQVNIDTKSSKTSRLSTNNTPQGPETKMKNQNSRLEILMLTLPHSY